MDGSPPVAAPPETAPLLSSGSGSNKTNAKKTTTTTTPGGTKLESSAVPTRWQKAMGWWSMTTSSSSSRWFPGAWDVRDVVTEIPKRGGGGAITTRVRDFRTWQRRIFLLLTEPDTSVGSALFFVLVICGIMVMNGVMMLQTMNFLQYTPTDCVFCGGTTTYLFDDDDRPVAEQASTNNNPFEASSEGFGTTTTKDVIAPCVCPPAPYEWTNAVLQYLIYFFSVEWVLRVLCYSPAPHERAATLWGRWIQWWQYVVAWQQALDFWATFPYYMEFVGTTFNSNGLMSLRLLRLFRVFQLVRLGSYNATFASLITVLQQATLHFKILLLMLVFGAALFGSLIFWLEQGTWQYWDATASYEFVRINEHGEPEVSPFVSIPATFYWFMVTATTVGYGDVYPTSQAGRWVGVAAMMTGVLVIAFPVSVFSDLWSKELQKVGALQSLENNSSSDGGLDDDDDTTAAGEGGGVGPASSFHSEDYYYGTPPNTTAAPRTPPSKVAAASAAAAAAAIPLGADAAAVVHDDSDGGIVPDEYLPGITTTTGGAAAGATTVVLPVVGDKSDHHHAMLNPYSAHYVDRVTGSATRPWNYGYQHAPAVHAGTVQHPNDVVLMQKSDLAELLVQLQQVQTSQKRIRAILKKYKLVKGGGSSSGGTP